MDEMMIARGNGANVGARLAMRLPTHGSSENRQHGSGSRQHSSGSSDSEDDAPIAAHFSKFMKTDRASRGSAYNSGGAGAPSADGMQVCTSSSTSSGVAPVLRKSETASPPPPPFQAKDSSKRPKPDAPKFLLLLYEILQTENPKVIRWSDDGLSLQILDQTVSQPELLQVIKRKKAPRRPATATATATATAADRAAHGQPEGDATAPTTLSQSPTNKRKLSAHTADAELHHPSHKVASGLTLQQHRGLNASTVSIHPSLHGVVITPLSQHHQHTAAFGAGTPMQRDSGAGPYLQASALLNNVISPLAASEGNKKAKKIDKTTYKPEYQSPTCPTMASMCDHTGAATMQGSSGTSSCAPQLSSVATNAYSTSHSLPTLDIVRSRIIRRQNASNPGHARADDDEHQKLQAQLYAGSYLGYSSPLSGQHSVSAAVTAAAMGTQHTLNSSSNNSRAELRGEGKANVGSPAPFPGSFSDPVDILLRIKKSRAMSSTEGQQHYGDGEGPRSPVGATPRGAAGVSNHNENLASLQSFIVNNTLYTNRLESQLKMAMEENDALKALVDKKHRELEKAQSEGKRLQNENAVLVDDQIKLLEINRELAAKLFRQ
ncbi:hypothetical protein PybrP1_010552 [[Pythium] brassicae (nom. inval.)]|nr:hypothetical protein PybrP1_010552 [[Pythium] brassicae (nom. inval.)]